MSATPPVDVTDLLASVPHLVVEGGKVVHVSDAVADEVGGDPSLMLGDLDELGTRLGDGTYDAVCRGGCTLRVRLGAGLHDRPVRLRRLGADGDRVWLEVRSLADEFRLESLLRRSGLGHMLLSPDIELLWSMTSNELADVFPGDDPLNWVELMDPDDMQVLGKAIHEVGRDPNMRSVVQHRLNADRTYTIIDTVESAVHDPDLRAVLVRSRLQDSAMHESGHAAPYAGITVSDHMPLGVVVASMSGTVLHRNAVAAELVGARAGQLAAPDGDRAWMLELLSGEHAARYRSVFASACDGRPAHCTIPSPFDPNRWLRVSASPAAASTVVLTIEDMTELSEAERALRASNRLLEALDSHSEELVVVFDADGLARYTSSSLRRVLGDGVRFERATDLIDYVHLADRSFVIELERRVRAVPAASESIDLRLEVDDDPLGRWHHARMTNLLDDPDVRGLVLTLRDVHERHVMERELRFWATHDALTTLPDRAALRTQLELLLHEAAQYGHRTALIFCDIDNFKAINDRSGHGVGDIVLTEVASRLRAALRGGDVVGRFGGDEFVVVVPNVDDHDHAYALADRVFRTVTGPVIHEGVQIDLGVSMGVAVTSDETATADDLLHRADLAMYRAKRDGRGRLAMYSDGDDDVDTAHVRS